MVVGSAAQALDLTGGSTQSPESSEDARQALKTMQRIDKRWAKVEASILDEPDYVLYKQVLREEPFSDLRRCCSLLIRRQQEQQQQQQKLADNDATTNAIQPAFARVIKNLERLDSTASLGARGKTITSVD